MDPRSGVSRLWLVCLSFLGALLLLVACGQAARPSPSPTTDSSAAVVGEVNPTATAARSEAPTPTATPSATSSVTPSPTPFLTPTPTETPRPSPTPRPTATRRPSPTPAGFWGDPTNGWSIQFPSDWQVTEEGERFPSVSVSDPEEEIRILAGWDYVAEDESAADLADTLGGMLTAQWQDVIGPTVEEISLQDGTVAQRISLMGQQPPRPEVQFVVAQRGIRVYILLILGRASTFEARARTIDTVVCSLKLSELRLYDVSRNSALVLAGAEPYDMDPATTEDGPSDYVGHIFSGLVVLNTDLQVAPDLAERWEISPDGRTYTFYLHPEALFHDGKPVTAADVKYSWERAADPNLGSVKTSTYLGDIVGVREKLAGEASDISGVVVVDDHTLQVTIDEPKVYFLAKLTWPVAFVVDRENVEAGGESNWWRQPNGTGPFRLETWKDEVMIFGRNESFYGPQPTLEHVVYLINVGPAVSLYESGEIDMAGVSVGLLDRVQDPADSLYGDLHTAANLCTSRVVFDNTQPPFDDPLVRQAFSYAVDRDKLITITFKGAVEPARGPLPPGMPGYSATLAGYRFDREQALDLLAQSPYDSAANLPPITLTTSGYSEAPEYLAALIQNWDEVFGIDIQVELLDPFTYAQEVKNHHGQMFSMGWCADYPDPQNFLDVLYHSTSEENLGGYHNPAADALLEQARSEPDPQARLALYQQVEQQIVDDAADVWLTHSTSRLLIKPYVHGYTMLPLGVPQVQNISLDPH
jgi:oligopeptide transport system substrate-binding protein